MFTYRYRELALPLDKKGEVRFALAKTLRVNPEEIFNLESLITDGADARVPIEIDFPTKNGKKKAAAMIRPLTNVEWNNALRISRKNFTTTN